MITSLLISIIIGQLTPIVICKTIELICPTFQLAPPSIKQSSSLDSSCFGLNISVNVENILPDATYILPEDNINAIRDGIKNTFSDSNVVIESSEIDNDWTICNQCDDSSPDTIHNMQFVKTQYNTSCNDRLHINKSTGTITCEFTLPESIVYVWHLQQINLYMDIKSESSSSSSSSSDENDLSMYTFHAKLIYNNKSITENAENVIAVSEPVIPQENGITQFVFDPSNNTLKQNTTYYVIFESVNASGHIPLENVYCDPNNHQIITISQPHSCTFGKHIAVTNEIQFGLLALCNESLAAPQQQRFESVLFQSHSSVNHVSGNIWNSLEERRRSRNLFGKGGDGGDLDDQECLGITFPDGRFQIIAEDDIYPNLNHCIAFDEDTRRVFAVGGNDTNGNALDRLKVYYLESQSNVIILDYPNLKLDKPRAMTTCYFYKRNDEEYIIAINGMNHTKYANHPECWYNDIVFIPLNNQNKQCNFPTIKLKFNLVDMKSFVTENDILYLIGGRNGQNATNVVQIIDLDQVFDENDSSSSSSSSSSDDGKNGQKSTQKLDTTTLTAHERMMPMNLHRVLPMADFTFIVNETCMVTWSGQHYINGKWVSVNESMTEIQMYCNKLLVGYLNTTRETLYGTSENIQFSEYDNQNLISNDMIEYDTMESNDRVSMLQYDFENDGLWYKFSVGFKICFDDKDEAQNKITFFSDFTGDNQQILEENILIESQKNYRDWSYGFGKVDITAIDIESTPCSKDSEEETKDSKNKKSKERNKYRAVSANMGDKIDEYNYQMDEHYDNNMWKNIVAFGLCIIFLLWLSITCCCNKYKLYNKLTTKKVVF